MGIAEDLIAKPVFV